MKKNPTSSRGIFNPRILLAFVLCSAGALLALASFTGMPGHPIGPDGSSQSAAGNIDRPQHYMPVPGGEPDDLDRLEVEWNNRLTYPTGIFDPAWVRLAALKDAPHPAGHSSWCAIAEP
jgi:hypothetical protein